MIAYYVKFTKRRVKYAVSDVSRIFANKLKGQSNEIFDLHFFFIIQTNLGH